jgi:hypothetical protein
LSIARRIIGDIPDDLPCVAGTLPITASGDVQFTSRSASFGGATACSRRNSSMRARIAAKSSAARGLVVSLPSAFGFLPRKIG